MCDTASESHPTVRSSLASSGAITYSIIPEASAHPPEGVGVHHSTPKHLHFIHMFDQLLLHLTASCGQASACPFCWELPLGSSKIPCYHVSIDLYMHRKTIMALIRDPRAHTQRKTAGYHARRLRMTIQLRISCPTTENHSKWLLGLFF